MTNSNLTTRQKVEASMRVAVRLKLASACMGWRPYYSGCFA
jgi:hypothetical protein